MDNGNGQQKHRMVISRRFHRLGLILIALLIGTGLSAIVVLGNGQSTPMEPYLVKDINTVTEPSDPERLTDVNGTLFFAADDGIHGVELWKSDGTPGGTMMVRDIHPTGSANPNYLVNVNGTLYFSASDDTHGNELWALEVPVNAYLPLVFKN